jgi:hypothetical protein
MHLGSLINLLVNEKKVSKKEVMLEFNCSYEKIKKMYLSPHLKSDTILKWSIILDYNLFDLLSKSYLKKLQNDKKIN